MPMPKALVATIVRPEIVTPGRDAVRLVHGHKRGRRRGQRRADVVAGQLLGSDEDEPGHARAQQPVRSSRAATPLAALTATAAKPRSRRLSTWFCCKDSSGEMITAGPPRATAAI